MDHEIILPKSVTKNKRATTRTSVPPAPPVIRDTASMRPTGLMSRTGTAAPMPKAENR